MRVLKYSWCFTVVGLLAGVVGATPAANKRQTSGLSPKVYNNLPLGQIKPTGWLQNQLNIQANGLAGNLNVFYPLITQGSWTGGTKNYSNLNEAGSYWYNGIVPLAYITDNSRLKTAVQSFLNHVLDTQWADGWLGNESNNQWQPRFLWGRYPFFFGAIMHVEADPSYTTRFVTAFHKFVALSNTMLKNKQGYGDWTQGTRWQDYAMALQWLYDNHPNGNEVLLLDTMQRIKSVSTNWRDVFSASKFPTTAVTDMRIYWHGVNLAEGLKASAATYRFTHDASEKTDASSGWDRLYQYHGRPSGIFAADEHLAGLEAIRGTELCLVVVSRTRASYLYQVFGEPKYAERAERQAYNSLPGTISGDMWSHQYLQQQNQVAVKNMNPNPFPSDGSYSNVFGLEPNYPCCTVNHPQGFPKFVANAFVASVDGKSLTQVYFGPLAVKTTLSGLGATVSVNVDTNYPFADNIKTTITTDKPFTFYIRVPTWINSQAKLQVGSAAATAFSPDILSADIKTESRPHGSIAIHRGTLNYALDIPRKSTLIKTTYSAEPRASDYQFDATGSWNYAIDPSTLTFNAPPSGTSLKSPIFDSGAPPLSISVTGCTVNWSLAGTTFANSPPEKPACTGAKTKLTLIPYGATKLRISEFPVISG
ncbi:glycoside hydrolase family 127 protein [Ceratobasidium sp. AG-Ba]|nr:glycoside hydrolase family 127 protein [Ceratobasidium sp. AG-Ba]